MNLISEFLSDAFIFSFGWTLLNSLWHGAIVSLLTLVFLYFFRRQRSELRYNITVVSLIVIVSLSIWTFISFYGHYNSTGLSLGAESNTMLSQNSAENYGNLWFEIMPEVLRSNLHYFTEHLPLIITVWFIFVLFLSIKYLGAYVYSQRLRHNRIKPVKAFWIDKLSELSKSMGVKKGIQLLESAIVRVPIVIGYFKPAVIVPLGFFTGIPSSQVEAILIHELAHIKRNDYLVKLLQTIVEILYFFNPFVWWISSIINKEREHCCDDLAISLTRDNISFVRALAGLCELEAGNTSTALAFGKSNNQIVKRMERIMKKNENKNNFSHFTIALVILLSSLIALGTTSIKTVNIDSKAEALLDTSKSALKANKKELDQSNMKLNKELHEIQESMVKLKAAYSEEKDADTKRKYKQKIKELEKKAKAVEMKHKELKKVGGTNKVKGVSKVSKVEHARKIDELKKKLSVVKDKETKIKIKKKIEQLQQEAESTGPAAGSFKK